jgi:alkylation response protein AidB-like acyl-CoA dehydrogenase
MDFGLDDEQLALAASVRAVIESGYGMTFVRRMLDDPRGFSPQFWSDAARLGWLGMLVEERFGGTARGPMEMVAVQQGLGRGVVPGPFLASAVIATVALERFGSEDQKERWLPAMVAGQAIATLAFQEERGTWDEAGIALPAPRSRATVCLTGEKRFVLDAQVADLVIVPARADEGVTLFLVESSLPGVTVQPMKTVDDTRRMCTVSLDGVQVSEDMVLGEVGSGWAALEMIADMGRVALCAEMVGGAERVLEMCADYARVREQFGRPIGSFQAIQHKCADMLVRLEGARAITFAAAASLARGDDDASFDASAAKSACAETYRSVTTEGVQIHGALGFSWEHDMHLFYKRAKASETFLGDSRFHRARLAERVLGAT